MNRVWILLMLFLVACGGNNQAGVFRPDPLPTATPRSFPNAALPVTLAELGANPPAYEGLLLRLSGAYSKSAPAPCFPEKGVYAKWGMVGEGLRLNAVGYESVLGLMPANTPMTVEGVWRQYIGPLGCGKEPPTGTVWYLETVNIIKPNPFPNFGIAVNSGSNQGGNSEAPVIATLPPTQPPVNGTIDPANQVTVIPTPLPIGTPPIATPTFVVNNPLPTVTSNVATATLSSSQDTATPTPTTTPTVNSGQTPTNVAVTPSNTPVGNPTVTSTLTPTPATPNGGATATVTPLPTETPIPSRTPVITSTPIPPQPTFTPGPYGPPTPYP